jgi:hypothetical protein
MAASFEEFQTKPGGFKLQALLELSAEAVDASRRDAHPYEAMRGIIRGMDGACGAAAHFRPRY